MKKMITFFILSTFQISFANSDLAFDEMEDNIFLKDKIFENPNVKKSHFFFNIETTLLMYKNDNAFAGEMATTKATDSMSYIGPSVGVGFRFPLAGSFETSSHAAIFQFVHRRHDVDKASEEIPITINEQENDNKITGIEFAQRFLYRMQLGDRSYIEPFVHVGIGFAMVRNKFEHYYYDYISSEYYYSVIKEDLITQNLGVGFNILHHNGMFFIMKVQKNLLTIAERTQEVSQWPLTLGVGTPTNSESTVQVDENRDEYSVTLGFGYIF